MSRATEQATTAARPRIRILFVLSQLVQHGSERYLFELCKAMDKERYDVEVLTRPIAVKHHYYYPLLEALGIRIRRRLISRRFLIYPIKPLYRSSSVVRSVVGVLHRVLMRVAYRRFFDSYDLIAVVGIETYCDALAPLLDDSPAVVIHHVNHRFQFERDYFAECRQKHIVVLDEQQMAEVRDSALHDAELFHFPLSMDLSDRPKVPIALPRAGEPVRIGVVSRLYRDRPNEPLFRCFHALLRHTDAVLYFYGGGDASQYYALLDELKIRDRVIFAGHQRDLAGAIVRDQLSMLWLVSMGTSISYGSIEVASLGMPMVFWNMSGKRHEEILAETDGAMHAFDDADEFAAFAAGVLGDADALQRMGDELRAHVIARFEITRHLASLDAYYESVLARADEDGSQPRPLATSASSRDSAI
ncbi:MAG TPA: glycosyltransferase [Gemmatimonadaceae bacterium]|jgi:glycosyltransferase involved in cell wall biosynthesis